MKKSFIALALAASIAPAWAAEVVSSNTVGYHKVTLNQGWNMVGVQFTDVASSNKDFSTVFQLDSSFAGYDDNYDFPTQLRVWNGDGYDYYGWAGTSGTDVDGDPTLDNTWTDLDAYAVSDTKEAFDGVWINAEKAGTLTVSGEVILTNVTVQVKAGYNMICNPYPAAVPITSFGVLDASFAGYDDNYDFPNQMRVWNGDGYDYYGWAGTSGTDVDGDSTLDNTWTDLDAYATDVVLPAGAAVWLNLEKAGTITFTAP